MSNNESHPIMKSKRLFIAMLAFFPWLSACATGTRPPKPPHRLPFSVQKAGSKVETELLVVEHREYIFNLRFGFKGNEPEDRKRVKKLVGEDGQFKNGDPGVPTPLRFKISVIEAIGERPILEQEIPELRLKSWGADSFDKHIAYVILKPGHYRISVESLKDAPELIGTPISFIIGSDVKSTTIK